MNTAFRNAPRAYASYIDESILPTSGSPVMITGIQFRLMAASISSTQNPPSDWPSQNLNFADFTIRMGQANATIASAGEIPTITGTFNDLFAAGSVITRTGGMTINTASMPFNPASTPASPNAWMAAITFATPYMYTPGQNLMYAISHTGYTPSTEFQPFFATANFGNSIADAVSSTTPTAGLDSAVAGFSSPYVVQFTTAAVPEPATMTVLAGLALVAARKRKKS